MILHWWAQPSAAALPGPGVAALLLWRSGGSERLLATDQLRCERVLIEPLQVPKNDLMCEDDTSSTSQRFSIIMSSSDDLSYKAEFRRASARTLT